MARICREAGARVRTNVLVRDLDLGAFDHLDGSSHFGSSHFCSNFSLLTREKRVLLCVRHFPFNHGR